MGEDLTALSAAQLRAKLAAATSAAEKGRIEQALAAKEAKKPGVRPSHPSPH
jgi:hypothetical protein